MYNYMYKSISKTKQKTLVSFLDLIWRVYRLQYNVRCRKRSALGLVLDPGPRLKKHKTGKKIQMRAELKLCYKEGFKLSSSPSFELQVRGHVLAYNPSVSESHLVHDRKTCTLLFCSAAQALNQRLAETSCYTALYSLVPLPFQSLLSLERRIVPCL